MRLELGRRERADREASTRRGSVSAIVSDPGDERRALVGEQGPEPRPEQLALVEEEPPPQLVRAAVGEAEGEVGEDVLERVAGGVDMLGEELDGGCLIFSSRGSRMRVRKKSNSFYPFSLSPSPAFFLTSTALILSPFALASSMPLSTVLFDWC